MALNIVSWIAVVLILVASCMMFVSRDWRMQLGALAVQYLSAFWLVTLHLPFAMAAAKLVTGWMVVAALGMTRLSLSKLEEKEDTLGQRGQWFSIILVAIVVFVTAGATPRIEAVVPGLGLQVIAGSLLLIGTGLIHLGLTSDILRVTLGLLTILTGFEVIYAALESSILVAGLLAITSLGLGLIGSYLLTAGSSTTDTVDEEQLL